MIVIIALNEAYTHTHALVYPTLKGPHLQDKPNFIDLIWQETLTFLLLLRPHRLSGVHGSSQVLPLQVGHTGRHRLLEEDKHLSHRSGATQHNGCSSGDKATPDGSTWLPAVGIVRNIFGRSSPFQTLCPACASEFSTARTARAHSSGCPSECPPSGWCRLSWL